MDLLSLDPIIHQPTRLRIMALLARNRSAAFTWVRDTLELTDGNLNSHATRLEKEGYIEQGRALTPHGFQVRLRITPAGATAYQGYLASLRALLQAAAEPPPVEAPAPAEKKTL